MAACWSPSAPARCAIIDHGKLLPEPVQGTPKVFVRQDGGMLDVAAHKGWIYLSYTEVAAGRHAGAGQRHRAQSSRRPP